MMVYWNEVWDYPLSEIWLNSWVDLLSTFTYISCMLELIILLLVTYLFFILVLLPLLCSLKSRVSSQSTGNVTALTRIYDCYSAWMNVCRYVLAEPALLHWHRHPVNKCLSYWHQLTLSLHRFFSPFFIVQMSNFIYEWGVFFVNGLLSCSFYIFLWFTKNQNFAAPIL